MSDFRTFGHAGHYWKDEASLPIVACDLDTLAEAIVHAVGLRRKGVPFAGHLNIPDNLTAFVWFRAAPSVLNATGDYDERMRFFHAAATGNLVMGGRAQSDFTKYDAKRLRAAIDFLSLADLVVFRSRFEAQQTGTLIGFEPRRTTILSLHDKRVPVPLTYPAELRDTVVVWAPDLGAEHTGYLAFALEELRRPVVIIAAVDQPRHLYGLRARIVPIADSATWLARALAIVDASLAGPAAALALTQWNAPLAVSFTSGAAEVLVGAVAYRAADCRSILRSVLDAIGVSAPTLPRQLPGTSLQSEVREAALSGMQFDGPLVTVVVPTYNRRSLLPRALASLERQMYRNVEILVVNDGGEAVDDIVAGSPRARLLVLPHNVGVNEAANAGMRQARGTYLSFCADDDELLPDALARFVPALERSGASIVNADCAYGWSRLRDDGSYAIEGYAVLSIEPVIPTDLLVNNCVSAPPVLLRRERFEALGGFDASSVHCSDYEAWLKLSLTSDVVHIDRVLGISNSRIGAEQVSAVSGPEYASRYRQIYARIPVDRPAINAARINMLNEYERIPEPPAATRPSVALDPSAR